MLELDYKKYQQALTAVKSADINTLFALAVLEKKVKGKVYVDDADTPNFYYISHPYGMSLLYGITDKKEFYAEIISHILNEDNNRTNVEYLQVYPYSLSTVIEEMLGNNLLKKDLDIPFVKSEYEDSIRKVLKYQRINFLFHKTKYEIARTNLINIKIDEPFTVSATTEEVFHESDGSVIPIKFWNTYKDFIDNGGGYTLYLNQHFPVSTAFTSFMIDNKLEIGIETNSNYQGLGYASVVCANLIDDCLTNNLEPVWSCNSSNIGSRKLANKLGFEEYKRIPYYILP